MYINNFPLDIIAVEMQNQTRMGGWVVGWWVARSDEDVTNSAHN